MTAVTEGMNHPINGHPCEAMMRDGESIQLFQDLRQRTYQRRLDQEPSSMESESKAIHQDIEALARVYYHDTDVSDIVKSLKEVHSRLVTQTRGRLHEPAGNLVMITPGLPAQLDSTTADIQLDKESTKIQMGSPKSKGKERLTEEMETGQPSESLDHRLCSVKPKKSEPFSFEDVWTALEKWLTKPHDTLQQTFRGKLVKIMFLLGNYMTRYNLMPLSFLNSIEIFKPEVLPQMIKFNFECKMYNWGILFGYTSHLSVVPTLECLTTNRSLEHF
ncbi:hypothetical protein PGT21_032305 [Puccinia graminis f. sp. tritici]|nr:hypothetical protein PGT21_032305 [Puccinia graminis f. sp. tritici]